MRGLLLGAVGLAMAVGAPAQAATTHRPAGGVEVRLRVMEDRAAIEDLLQSYTAALDAADWNGYADVFAKDGVLVWLGTEMKGRETIRARMANVVLTQPDRPPRTPRADIPSPAPGRGARAPQRHILSNIRILSIDGDHARTTARWTLVVGQGSGAGRDAVDSTGRYVDEEVRENGHWKIAHRVIMGDIPFDDPSLPRAPGAPRPPG